jgi:predicted PurR-regulated permease PerM
MSKIKPQLIDLSILSIIKFFLVLVFLFFIFYTRSIWAIVFVALILTAALRPSVNRLASWKIPRNVSVIVFLLVLVSFLAFIVSSFIPLLIEQSTQFFDNFPIYSQKINQGFSSLNQIMPSFPEVENYSETLTELKAYFTPSASSVFSQVVEVFGGLVSFVLMIVLTFYLLIDETGITQIMKFVVPGKYQPFLSDLINKIQKKIAAWLKGQLILSLIVSLLVYISLLILGVDYALVLALLAFVGEFIPYLGPILAAVPAVFVAFVSSPILGLFVLIIFIIIQQAENHVLVPKVMQHAVGLNPVISIISLLIGAKIAGLVGVVLAIPVVTAIGVLINEIYAKPEASITEGERG